ncbi:MAG: NADH-quinone oxidoreductase subunit L [Bacteroidota bacterium]
MAHELIGIAVFLPLAGFLVNGLGGRFVKSETAAGLIGSATVGGSFVAGCLILARMLGAPPGMRVMRETLFPWIGAGSVNVDFGYQADQLSVLMMLIVTGVGFLIHVYSIGYMRGDPGFRRFFAYLNLFIFAMLNLVMADNFLLLFLGWEGVGLCSYLLIGFWYDRRFEKGTTADAAKKAFIVNRIGDVGFLIGMFLVMQTFGTLRFEGVFAQAAAITSGQPIFFWMTLALFLGATGKSAQIPLFVWLPDAMAGPTPVSALIHAATMVTAGVYMVARCSVLFALAPGTLAVVAVVGALTLVMAASIALVQNDIKKVLAYSTVSQLGYMFVALGVGAFGAGVFHVLTHAFFKALLFLGAGAVIHALHEEQDIRKMGGLGGRLPVTYASVLAGALALAGIPPLSGFVSKDEILWKVFAGGSWGLWLAGLVGAGFTAFYIFRLVTLVFAGEPRWSGDRHPHEAPRTMTVPLVILALLSAGGGLLGWPASLGGGNLLEHWLEPVFAPALRKLALGHHGVEPAEYVLMALSVGVGIGGILLARRWYLSRRDVPERLAKALPAWYRVLLNKYYVDEVYDAAVVAPTVKISERFLWKTVDVGVIDWCVNALAASVAALSQASRRLQSGAVQSYALVFLGGAVALLAWILLA